MSTEELAYLAGLLDGEGSLMIRKFLYRSPYYRYIVVVQVAMTHRETIEWFADKCSTVVYEILRGKDRKTVWRAQLNSGRAQDLLRSLEPYLITKKQIAQCLLRFPRPVHGKHNTDGMKEAQEAVYQEYRFLMEGTKCQYL